MVQPVFCFIYLIKYTRARIARLKLKSENSKVKFGNFA